MSDLSRLLDDLYRDDSTVATIASWDAVPPPEPTEPVMVMPVLTSVPSWSSDEALDEAFASWVPGPDLDASHSERAIVAGSVDEKIFEPVVTLDDMRTETPILVDRVRWSPSDDDILPVKKGRRRFR